MTTFTQVEEAAKQLRDRERFQLPLPIAASLRTPVDPMPPPREFTREQIEEWLDEDVQPMPNPRVPAFARKTR